MLNIEGVEILALFSVVFRPVELGVCVKLKLPPFSVYLIAYFSVYLIIYFSLCFISSFFVFFSCDDVLLMVISLPFEIMGLLLVEICYFFSSFLV